MRNDRNEDGSKFVSYGAIVTALSVVLTFMGNIIPASAFIAPILAGFVLIVVKIKFGIKKALVTFAAVVALMFVLSPKKMSPFSYLLLFGYYPVLFDEFYNIRSVVIRIFFKIALFEGIGGISLFILLKFLPAFKENQRITLLIILGIVLYNIFAVIYDRFIYLFLIQYREQIQNKVKKI